MPSTRANVKNEKQYEALKDKGMSKQRARQDRQLARRVEGVRKKSHSGSGKSNQGGTTASTARAR